MSAAEPRVVAGSVEPSLAAELPGLRLRWTVVDVARGGTPAGARQRLDALASRLRGAEALALRRRPVPQAYRAAFRQLGLDPDVERTPVEALVVERLLRGGLATGERLADALTLATAETGAALVALDDAALRGELTLRAARAGEPFPHHGHADDLPAGRLVLADAAGPVAVLFGRASGRHAAGRRTARVRLVAIGVAGVPDAHLDEALWLATSALAD